MVRILAKALFALALCHTTTLMVVAVQGAEVKGLPRVIDGDTVAIGSTRIRLQGIDAPETDQICLNRSGARWACGIEARDRLATHLAGREISCASSGLDAYKRILGDCKVGVEDLNGWMVHEGWALAYVKYSAKYLRAEEEAKSRQRGLWQGAFIAPWDWRHRNDKTEILGSLSVPKDAQALLIPRSAVADAPSPQCVIKGNINQRGERIYHVPGQQFYDRVQIDSGRGKRWFCTREDAEAAGWRPALR